MPAGLNAYVPLLIVALADRYTGLIHLAGPYDVISSPIAILIIAVLLGVELLADKIPLVDHVNDLVQSAVRPAAGAILLMATTEPVPSINPVVAMLVGLSVAGGIHVAKTSFRPLVTATTGGLGNPVVSAVEDGTAIVGGRAGCANPDRGRAYDSADFAGIAAQTEAAGADLVAEI
jgi:hypothetical protein